MAKTPELIGKYEIHELLATGGMGAVYKGMHPTLGRYVIIKKLTLRGNPDFAERFRREARILMDFRNEGIVDVYDHFKEGRSHYIVMEYIDGLSLEQLIRRERYLPNDMALFILRQVAKALYYAHQRGVIHRDIKPANILISRTGDVKLVDFGIASSKEETAEEGLTRDGMTLGSPAYMAPEQFENSRSVDKRADIYSLGVMLYESVTGKKPYPGGFSADLMAAIMKGRYPHPGKFNPKVNYLVRSLIRRSMKPKKKRRYQDLLPLIRRLDRYFSRKPLKLLKVQLRNAIRGKSIEPIQPGKPRGKVRILQMMKRTGVAALLLVAIGASLYITGTGSRLFLRNSHGELKLQVRMAPGYKEADEYYLKGWIFQDAGDDGVELGEKPFRFTPRRDDREQRAAKEKRGDSGSSLLFETGSRFLPEGEYRVKLQVEDTVYWNSFTLSTMKDQENPRRILFSGNTDGPQALKLDFFVQDGESWADITGASQIEVLVDGRWEALTKKSFGRTEGFETEEGPLYSGKVYRFKFTAPGYQEKIFSLLIHPDQRSLNINPKLRKEGN